MLNQRELLDREAIRDCIYRYCVAVDRMDAPLLESVYWPEATEDRGSVFRGSAAEFRKWALERLGSMVRTQHFIGNIFIRLDGHRAHTESYLHCYHRVALKEGGAQDEFIGGRYQDVFERRGGEWRMLHRACYFDWFRVEKGQDPKDEGYKARGYDASGRKPSDPFYGLFAGFIGPLAVE